MSLTTLKSVRASRREKLKIPKSVQDTIPVTGIWEDGIFQHTQTLFSRTYQFSDVNYLVASQDERRTMFRKFQQEVLHILGSGATYKITTNNRSINMAQFQKDTLIHLNDDGQNEYREEYNRALLDKVAAADGIMQEKYITVSVSKPSIEEARSYFNRTFISLRNGFASMGSKLVELDAVARLRILHDFFRPGEEDQFEIDFTVALRRGHDFRDSVCPGSIKRQADHLMLGEKYARVLFAIEYPAYVQDDYIFHLTELPRNMMVSVDIITIPREEAEQEVQLRRDSVEANITRWQNRQNQNNNFSAVIPYDMSRQREEMENFMDDLTKQDQGMHLATFTLIHTADTLEQLDADTERLKATRGAKLICATFQQLDGMATALPFGVCRIDSARTILTRCLAAISMPFRVQELQEPRGIWFGENAVSRNPILCNRANLQNQGTFILGIPGSGKSMMAKLLIVYLILGTQDNILINDPEGEYTPIVRAMGGTVIQPKAGGSDHLNAMDLEVSYGQKDAIAVKAQYIQSLFERVEKSPTTAQEQSIIDRCVLELYARRWESGHTVTLNDLRELLKSQQESEGKKLALTLERYTTGSLDIFAHETNVDMSNRVICFDLSKMSKELRPAGQLTITDFMTNRVDYNAQHGIRTHVVTDEIQVFYANPHSADFFDAAWRQWRKRGAYPVAITQNVSVLLNSDTATAMLSNSEMIIMLNQAAPDREKLAEVFHISLEQMRYVHDSEPGCGLLRYGKNIIPFVNRFPKNTKLYQLMTTKPEEGFRGGDIK